MATPEPGLDRHAWESEFETIEPELHDFPAQALPELGDLVERMLDERGYDLDEPVAREGDEREIVSEYLSAREVSDRVERGEDVDPGDVGSAVNGFRAIYDFLIAEREAP